MVFRTAKGSRGGFFVPFFNANKGGERMAGRTLQSTIEIAGTLSPSLQQAIRQAIDRLEEMSEETLESAGAAARLADEIGAQESVLRSLQRGSICFSLLHFFQPL